MYFVVTGEDGACSSHVDGVEEGRANETPDGGGIARALASTVDRVLVTVGVAALGYPQIRF